MLEYVATGPGNHQANGLGRRKSSAFGAKLQKYNNNNNNNK